jgi:redox-sensitive bicupin YhaK (pirin superfamily)
MSGDEAALPIRADARILGATIKAGETVDYALSEGRYAYLVPAHGKISIGSVTAEARDGVAIRDESNLTITALEDSEVVLVDAV